MLLIFEGANYKEKRSTENKHEFYIKFYLIGFEFLNMFNLVTTRISNYHTKLHQLTASKCPKSPILPSPYYKIFSKIKNQEPRSIPKSLKKKKMLAGRGGMRL